jgi:hypothetical protein
MTESSGYAHDASDRKLTQAADAATEADEAKDAKHAKGPGHDPEKIARHDDTGKDRLFEHREQRDEAEKNSEKTRRAKDAARHDHPVDEVRGDS